MDDGLKEHVVSAEVPQTFMLGPLLWNIIYNYVLLRMLNFILLKQSLLF